MTAAVDAAGVGVPVAVDAPEREGAAGLPDPQRWRRAASCHADLFAPLDAGARVVLVPRSAPSSMLVWHAGERGVEVRVEPFAGYAQSGADIALAADDEALAELAGAAPERLFEVLRAAIRTGRVVCYMLRRRCHLEERGFDELLDALGFVFMGACR